MNGDISIEVLLESNEYFAQGETTAIAAATFKEYSWGVLPSFARIGSPIMQRHFFTADSKKEEFAKQYGGFVVLL